jgi:hypothetical protein
MTNGARADGYAAVLLSLAAALAVVLAIGPQPVGVFQDDGAYVILARSLAQGEGFRFSNIPGEPVATHYPPLYPVLLAALWKLSPAFPANVTLFKFVNAALLGAAAAGAFYFARRTLGLEVWFSSRSPASSRCPWSGCRAWCCRSPCFWRCSSRW